MYRPKIILADDHPLVIEQLCNLVNDEFEVLATARDGCELVQAARLLHPDVIVTDISMPNMDGLEAARVISGTMPSTRVIFVTVHNDVALARSALRVGHGYVLKSFAGEDLIDALHAVLNNGRFVSPSIMKHGAW